MHNMIYKFVAVHSLCDKKAIKVSSLRLTKVRYSRVYLLDKMLCEQALAVKVTECKSENSAENKISLQKIFAEVKHDQ